MSENDENIGQDGDVTFTPRTFTFYQIQDASFWTRVKLGLSLLLAPITIPLIGRTIRVRMEKPKETK